MARRRYRRRYRRKGRWSSNIKAIEDETIAFPGNQKSSASITLCYNPVQSDNTVSQQYTVKNVELSYEINYMSNAVDIESITGYIMFVPQGMIVGEDYAQFHPEYIMAMKFYGSPDADTTPNRSPMRIKTRLSRRLNTGDSIIFYITALNNSANSIQTKINGLLRWWTKAN